MAFWEDFLISEISKVIKADRKTKITSLSGILVHIFCWSITLFNHNIYPVVVTYTIVKYIFKTYSLWLLAIQSPESPVLALSAEFTNVTCALAIGTLNPFRSYLFILNFRYSTYTFLIVFFTLQDETQIRTSLSIWCVKLVDYFTMCACASVLY